MNRFVVPLLAVIVLLGFFYVGLQRDPGVLPSQYIGKPAPEFDLPDVRYPDVRVSNADLKGRISLVNIWATWCVGCRAEHEFLNGIAQQGQFPIIGINWRDERSAALGWLENLGDPYEKSGYDADGRVGIDWGVYGAPETFLINAEGNVVYRYPGPLDAAVWDEHFVPLIEGLQAQ